MPAAARAAQAAAASSTLPPGSSPAASAPGPVGFAQTGAHAVIGDDTAGGGEQDDHWPFDGAAEQENEVHTGKEGRGWLRTAIVVGVLLVVVVAMAIAFNQGRQNGNDSPGAQTDPTPAAPTSGSPVQLAGVTDFDPAADPPEENPETVANAIDGDQATSWTTSTYRGNAALGGLKPGVGLMVDLGSEQEATSVSVRFKGQPTSFEVYAAPAGVTEPPDSLDQLDQVGAQADAPARATVQLDPTPKTRYLLVWLTRLPQVSGGFRGEIADITVRS